MSINFIILILLYLTYNYIAFYYSSYIFQKNTTFTLFVTTSMINSYLFILPVYVLDFKYEFLIMILYIVSFGLCMFLFFTKRHLSNLFGTFTFAVNFFATKIILIAVFSLVQDKPIIEIINDKSNREYIMMLTFIISTLRIPSVKKIITNGVMDTLLSNKKSLTFATVMMLAVYVNLLIYSFVLYTNNETLRAIPILLKVSIYSLLLFFLVMICSYIFANLHLSALRFNLISKQTQEEQNDIINLEKRINIDNLTQTYVRSVAEKRIFDLTATNETFFIIYVDLDGLKFANDTYGHDEGDFYIKKVASELLTTFQGDTVSRIGGDEFLVIGLAKEHYDGLSKIVFLDRQIKEIQKIYEKPYSTSISYGFLFVDKDNQNSVQELIKEADNIMYSLKKTKKAERKVTAPKSKK